MAGGENAAFAGPIKASAAVLLLLLAGCQSASTPDKESRVLTRGNYMPLCLVVCQISTVLTSHEGNVSSGGGVTSTQTGGTLSSAQSKGTQ